MHRTPESLMGGFLVLAAVALFVAGMVLRLMSSPWSGGWITEVTIYVTAWALLISAAGGVAEKEHVRADFFLRLVGPRLRHSADLLAAGAGLAFCLAMAWFGWKVVQFAMAWDERGPSFLQIPTAWFYAALPVSMLACSIRYLLEILALVRGGPDRSDA